MASADTLRFECKDCGYKARIPRRYEGKSIKCPSCSVSQIATESESESVGDTVALSKLGENAAPQPAPPHASRRDATGPALCEPGVSIAASLAERSGAISRPAARCHNPDAPPVYRGS